MVRNHRKENLSNDRILGERREKNIYLRKTAENAERGGRKCVKP